MGSVDCVVRRWWSWRVMVVVVAGVGVGWVNFPSYGLMAGKADNQRTTMYVCMHWNSGVGVVIKLGRP